MLRDFSVKGKARVKVVDDIDGTTTYDINLQRGEMCFKAVKELSPEALKAKKHQDYIDQQLDIFQQSK